ncbi:MAG: ABC transporter permease [Oscillospiraceae bacterium]|nr:ABC transporter permease [Oscillospiraceae bacterium]
MRTIWMLAVANLRKNKSQTFSIGVLILISIMLLNIALTMFSITNFFDQRAEELNAPHWVSWVPPEYAAERYAFVRDFPTVVEAEYGWVLFSTGHIEIQGEGRSGAFIIAPYTEAQRMNPPYLIGESLPMVGDAMYVPHFMTLDSDIAIGDEIIIDFGGEELPFTLAGATEEIMFGALMYTQWRIYVSESRFDALRNQFPDSEIVLVSARLEEADETFGLSTAYWEEFMTEGASIQLTSRFRMREARTSGVLLPAMLVAVFSLIMLIVGVIVIRFRIINGIDEGMVNMGVQKAMGYRNKEIILSLILQFGLITVVGGVIGVLASHVAIPLVSGLIAPLFGLIWRPAFNMPLKMITLVAALLAVAICSLITALRIRKLHPLTALRGGISTHSFKRNPFALDKSRGSLVLLLALKNLLMNKKQALMVSLIIFAVAFASVGSIAVYYNIIVNDTAFMRVQMGDVADVWLDISDTDYIADVRARVAARPEVIRVEIGDSSGVTPLSVTSIIVNGLTIRVAPIADFTNIADYPLVAGRFPHHDNEIVIGVTTLEAIGVQLGDWVTVTGHDGETQGVFIVTGSTQSTNHEGMIYAGSLALVGNPMQLSTLSVRLLADADPDDFIKSILVEDGDIISDAINIRSMIDEMLAPMRNIFRVIAFAVLATVTTVVILVLYIVIKTTLLRRRRELGIQKAVGFTTLQLMNQIALGFIPTILLGAVSGAVIGYLRFNAIFVVILRGSGIVQANLPVPFAWTIGMCIALIALSYTVSMLVAWRIRKISAYALVTE